VKAGALSNGREMMPVDYYELLLLNLRGRISEGRREYLTREEARKFLVKRTGQDFGFDVEAWERWISDTHNATAKQVSAGHMKAEESRGNE